MSDDALLAEYQKQTDNIARLLEAIEKVKVQRAAIAKSLLDQNGKGHVYTLNGVLVIVSTTKIGTHFLAPKEKWKGRKPRKPKEASEVATDEVVGVVAEEASKATVPATEALNQEPATVPPPKEIDPLDQALADLDI